MCSISKTAHLLVSRSSTGKVTLASVAAAVAKSAPVKLGHRQAQALCRYALQFFAEQRADLLTELTRWHAAHIDPSELSASTVAFECLGNVVKYPALQNSPLLRLHVAIAMYTTEHAIARPRPQPDVANLITQADLETFLKSEPQT